MKTHSERFVGQDVGHAAARVEWKLKWVFSQIEASSPSRILLPFWTLRAILSTSSGTALDQIVIVIGNSGTKVQRRMLSSTELPDPYPLQSSCLIVHL
jgi:hypothetical protein